MPNAAYFLDFCIAQPWERRRLAGSQMRIPAIYESAKGRRLAWLLASNGCDARKWDGETPALPGPIAGFSYGCGLDPDKVEWT